MRALTLLGAAAALEDLPTIRTTVQTPLAEAPARVLTAPELCVVVILRAALGMVDGVRDLVPEAVVGHLGLKRDETTHIAEEYYVRLPDRMDQREVLVVDPMLATGGSSIHALDVLARHGVGRARLLCLIAAPEGVEAVRRAHPEVRLTLCAVDDHLDPNAYIVPGLGDAGDRLYGTFD